MGRPRGRESAPCSGRVRGGQSVDARVFRASRTEISGDRATLGHGRSVDGLAGAERERVLSGLDRLR